MGSFSESKTQAVQKDKQEQETDVNMGPWKPQQNYLKDIFGQAQDIFNSQSGNQYSGDQIAGFTPGQLDMFKNMQNFANTSPLAGMMQGYGTNMSDQGVNGVKTGMEGLTNFHPSGSVNGTIADAGLYADNPYISGQVDAAMRDANRQVYEGQIPQSQRNAALSGNTNSSKSALSEGVIKRGLAEKTADVSAGLRGDAYNHGLDLSQAQNQFNDTTNINRFSQIGGLGVNSFGLGQGSLNNSLDAAGTLFGIGQAGGAGEQAANQATLDNDRMMSEYANSQQWAPLMNYFNLIGSQNWGQSGNTSQQGTGTTNTNGSTTASPAATIGGILGGIGSFMPWGKK